MIIDPSTNIGKLRLRIGDYSDLPFLPDSVYTQVLSDNDDNLNASAITLAKYILGQLAFQTHRKMGIQMEVWGSEAYKNYKDFLLMTVKDPSFMDLSMLPYATTDEFNPIFQFQQDWNKNFPNGTESQQLASNGSLSPNDGSLYGPVGNQPIERWAD